MPSPLAESGVCRPTSGEGFAEAAGEVGAVDLGRLVEPVAVGLARAAEQALRGRIVRIVDGADAVQWAQNPQ